MYFIPLTVSEKKKNINTVASLSSKIMAYGIDRKDTVIALGGGILGDIVGFTASIILRCINYIQLPTTDIACQSLLISRQGRSWSYYGTVSLQYYRTC
jgi:3-dehydroquinate synthase